MQKTHLNVKFQGDRTNIGMEVEESSGAASKPLGDVSCIAQGRTQSHNTNVAFNLRADVTHTRADDFKDRSFLSSDQVKLIHNEEVHILHILSLFPTSGEHVPLLGSADDNVALKKINASI
jgi:hypothetical protein